MREEINFKALAQEYEEQNREIEKRVAQLKSDTKVGSQSERCSIHRRIYILENIRMENRAMIYFLRKRDRGL